MLARVLACCALVSVAAVSVGSDSQARRAVAAGDLAFASTRTGRSEIYVMDADGSNVRRLTTIGAASPAWSSDGRSIAFASRNVGGGQPNYEIYVMNADGSGVRRLTRTPTVNEVHPAWSPDGTTIAFTRYPIERLGGAGYSKVYVMDADGSRPRSLTGRYGEGAAWSPDGQRIAVEGLDGVLLMRPDGTDVRRLATPGWSDGPAWSPDGTRIAVAGICVIRIVGAGRRCLTKSRQKDAGPTWSPNGTMIAFASNRSGNWEIYLVHANGTGEVRLTRNAASDSAPAWRPR